MSTNNLSWAIASISVAFKTLIVPFFIEYTSLSFLMLIKVGDF
jgi:hypothetical protein